MRIAIVVGCAALLAACASLNPVPIHAGDICFRCRRVIAETRLAGEIIDMRGRAFTFRTAGCMARYLNEYPEPLRGLFVTDYSTGKLLRAEAASFVRMVIDEQTYEQDYAAFASVNDAVAQARQSGTNPVDWLAVMRRARAPMTSN